MSPPKRTNRGRIELGVKQSDGSVIHRSMASLIHEADLFRHYYGHDSVDIVGPDCEGYFDPCCLDEHGPDGQLAIFVRHCSSIGLAPSVFFETSPNLDDVADLGEAGLDEWIFQFRGYLPAGVSRPVRWKMLLPDGFPVDIGHVRPARLTVYISPESRISDVLSEYGKALKEWSGQGWDIRLFDIPHCLLDAAGLMEFAYGWTQSQQDPYGYSLESVNRVDRREIVKLGSVEKMRARILGQIAGSRSNPVCDGCKRQMECLGPPDGYLGRFGMNGLKAYD